MRRMLMLIAMMLVATASVHAESRTVCFRLKLADDRYNCPAASEAGARRACAKGSSVDAVGHQVELWDKDWTSDDERIGTWYIGGGGTQCIDFEWERADYAKGEINPDLYLRYINVVNRTGYSNYVRVKAVTTDGNDHPATSWRNGQPNDPERYIAMNCGAGAACYMFPSGNLVPTNDIASQRALRIMALDSAQHMLQTFGELMDRHVNLHYPGRSDCTTSCAPDRSNFHIFSTQGGDGVLTAHELGHNLQMQRFGRDDLRDDLSKGGSGWNLTSDEFDSGATQEGFASYVAVVSWYEPNDFATVPRGWSLDFETAAGTSSTCSANRGVPVQVAKGFWDLDDWNNEAGTTGGSANDSVRYATDAIIRGWDMFPDGSGNRENNESGQHGVNMWDYFQNNRSRFTAAGFEDSFVRHNCLQDQAG